MTRNLDMLPAIITSILDTDAYKLHMQQAVFHHYPDATVIAEFRCRQDDLLGQYVDEIKRQTLLMESLTLSQDEFNYLSSIPFLKADFLNWLKNWRFDSRLLTINNEKGKLTITIKGRWLDVILWEIPLLAIVSEVTHVYRTPEIGVFEAIEHLKNKLKKFETRTANLDMAQFNVVDFGTRRRYSFAVQEAVVNYLKSHFSYFKGTSNYLLAHRLGLTPVGTQAHEWFQAHQQLSPSLNDCQKMALQVWLDEYPNNLGIALTDCITMDVFLRDFHFNFATKYQGLRHDSGDPIEWGEKAIAHYKQLGIDPKTKVLVFSDGLNLDNAVDIYEHFNGQVQLSFGIGGGLACDIPPRSNENTQPLNIVIKLTKCNGKSVAKLSDSPGKTISQDAAFIDELKRVFNINNN